MGVIVAIDASLIHIFALSHSHISAATNAMNSQKLFFTFSSVIALMQFCALMQVCHCSDASDHGETCHDYSNCLLSSQRSSQRSSTGTTVLATIVKFTLKQSLGNIVGPTCLPYKPSH